MNTQGRDIWVFNIIKNKGKINIKEQLKAPSFFFFFFFKGMSSFQIEVQGKTQVDTR